MKLEPKDSDLLQIGDMVEVSFLEATDKDGVNQLTCRQVIRAKIKALKVYYDLALYLDIPKITIETNFIEESWVDGESEFLVSGTCNGRCDWPGDGKTSSAEFQITIEKVG